MFCEIDGWVLGGMQFAVPVHVLFWVLDILGAGDSAGSCLRDCEQGAAGHAVWGAGAGAVLGGLLVAHFCEIDGRVLGGHAVWLGLPMRVLLWGAVWGGDAAGALLQD